MKKKEVKKGVNSKNNYFKYAAILVVVVFAVVGVSRILGLEINKSTRICEDKKGNLFVPRDKDGNIDECNKHEEAVSFNFDSGDNYVPLNGDVLFADLVTDLNGVQTRYILLRNGAVYKQNAETYGQNSGTNGWVSESGLDVPKSIIDKGLVHWSLGYLQTKEGKVYMQSDWGTSTDTIGNWNLLQGFPAVTN